MVARRILVPPVRVRIFPRQLQRRAEYFTRLFFCYVRQCQESENRYTIEFLGTWELIHNPNFKVVEFDHLRMSAGLPSFVLSASEWIERTGAIGLIVKKGRYGGTYAHKDIAFEFGSAISVQFLPN